MRPLKINEIVKAVGAIDYSSAMRFDSVDSVAFDSRENQENGLFVPLQGIRDGHDFVDDAIANGAKATFWAKDLDQAPKNIGVIQVEDTLQALQDLAQYYLAEIAPKVVAVTGSSGKTTTKDMTAAVLSAGFNVHKTEGNYNNEIGLPMTILAMPEATEVLVLEMGMSGRGEIDLLSRLAQPDVAIITMIGESHIEYLGSRKNIAKAKLEILSGLKADGTFIYPGEEDLINQELNNQMTQDLISVGTSDTQNVYAMDIVLDQYHAGFTTNLSPTCHMDLPVTGAYNVQNALYALATAYVFGLSMEQVQEKLAHFKLTANRMEWFQGYNDAQILNDAYNANPSAMRAVISNLAMLPSNDGAKKVLVLGDMLELGEDSATWHASVAQDIDQEVFSEVFLFGPEMQALETALSDKGYTSDNLHYFPDDKEALIATLKAVLAPQDLVLVKASNGTGLLELVDALRLDIEK
ncbi:UDP-N-acetylmuramoyl-tripeptide--D-alanyl-D-alanine ligase [Aerococcus kribbianus]|uniref:UDP-N-acetylmuramoyl-tripeptide--D-alanyl-D-alanine ligase n=1 Tax=Aerococcus kribbianus TaxID=2999064 RepID=A0A9X3FQJ1_9LACT|nr:MULTISPECIES: UDP-N-acetylmuramoyl-tripeptide--D-alanyl-D-alanine ligase [unclassified Aerococcus]MCZ0717884.1 UDP-N-acetylmuramoyl-tripeptide--D-alanyl-D-alanine ligase [Aerococcus sp. YH-aer221]MCZ0726171.1 UDP-N-acetylmuramoyl-tripeptide--D-alanyl-D-alanine ligase [Aerococcus sp. YH-aer222]